MADMANVNETVQGVQSGGSDVVLDVPPGATSLPQQAQQAQTDQAAMVPDTSERAAAVHALSAVWGQDFSSAWLADPNSEATEAASMALLKRHWGEGWQENLTLAKQVITDHASPALRKALETSGLGNDPSVIMLMGSIGVALQQARQQATQAQREPGDPTPPSRAQGLDDQIAKTMADPAYFNENHQLHKQAVAAAQKLFAARYRE